jgi:hypothetical protein
VPPGVLAITAIAPGHAIIAIVTPTDILSLPVTVTDNIPTPGSLSPSPGGQLLLQYQPQVVGTTPPPCLIPPPLPVASALEAACARPALPGALAATALFPSFDATVAGQSFRAHAALSPGISLTVSSTALTPFDPALPADPTSSTPPGPVIDLSLGRAVDIISAPSGLFGIAHISAPPAAFHVGLTPAGPGIAADLSSGPFHATAAAIAAPAGILSYATATLSARPVDIGVTIAPSPAWLIRYSAGPLTATLGASGGALQAGVAYPLSPSVLLQALYSQANGLTIAATIATPWGPVSTTASPSGLQASISSPTPATGQPVTAPIGPGQISFSSPAPGAATPPAVQLAMALAPGPIPSSPALPPPTPNGPATALLIVRSCVTRDGEASCGDSSAALPLTVMVDGQPVQAPSHGLVVTPGPHTVTVPDSALPALLVPVSPLTCLVAPEPGAPATCSFAFRRP